MFEQLSFGLSTVQDMSVAPVTLSMSATVAESLPLSTAFVSAYRLLTTAPLAGIGPVSRPLLDRQPPESALEVGLAVAVDELEPRVLDEGALHPRRRRDESVTRSWRAASTSTDALADHAR